MRKDAEMTFGAAFGALVKRKRGIEGLTQQELAVSAFGEENNKGQISRLEKGHVSAPHQKTVDALITALNISEAELQKLPSPAMAPCSAEGGADDESSLDRTDLDEENCSEQDAAKALNKNQALYRRRIDQKFGECSDDTCEFIVEELKLQIPKEIDRDCLVERVIEYYEESLQIMIGRHKTASAGEKNNLRELIRLIAAAIADERDYRRVVVLSRTKGLPPGEPASGPFRMEFDAARHDAQAPDFKNRRTLMDRNPIGKAALTPHMAETGSDGSKQAHVLEREIFDKLGMDLYKSPEDFEFEQLKQFKGEGFEIEKNQPISPEDRQDLAEFFAREKEIEANRTRYIPHYVNLKSNASQRKSDAIIAHIKQHYPDVLVICCDPSLRRKERDNIVEKIVIESIPIDEEA